MSNKYKEVIGALAVIIVILAVVNSRVGLFNDGSFRKITTSDVGGIGIPMMQYSEFAETAVSELAMMDERSFMPEPPRGGDTAATADQKIIRTGYLTLLVDGISEALPKVSEVALKYSGFTQNSNSGEYPSGERYGYVTIRVPASAYEMAINDIRALAIKVVEESTNAQDVTEEYTDLETRLGVAREEERAYLTLLDRADSVSDLIEVQRELSNVRARIESIEGRIKYLSNQTDLSTITVSLEEDASVTVPTKPYRFISTVKNAFRGAVNIGQNIITIVVWVVVVGAMIVVPLGLIYWVGRMLWNRRKK